MTTPSDHDGKPGEAASRASSRIGGRYEVGELLGRGGMAEVRKGTDVRLGRTVAIKRLRTDLASDQTFLTRFRREAQASASLNHPSIVAVYDTGEEMSTDGTDVAQPYIVMEFVEGRTLREILREGRKILPERALEITAGVLDALDNSHRAGIIHRDIKPANVMLTPAGDVKVVDFGIARAMSDASSTMTQTAAVIGTAQYLSPEQARGEKVDARSDVYSTGCLLYELLTGRPPFVGESPVSVAYQHVREQADPPSSLDPEVPSEVDAMVMKSLAKSVEDRYQSAGAMRADLERFLAGKPVVAPVVPVDDGTTFLPTTGAAGTRSAFDDPDEEKKRRWPLVVLAVVVAALMIGAAVFGPMLFTSNEPPQQSVPTLVMMTRAQAEAQLTDVGLTLGEVAREPSVEVRRGLVISQNPDPRVLVDPGTDVDILVSSGPAAVIVPFVLGDERAQAAAKLEDRGLRVRFEERDSDEDAGTVIDSDPRPAASVRVGTLVTLFYSDGAEQVPNVVGFAEDEATQTLQSAGFEVSVSVDSVTVAENGTVIQQNPQPRTRQPEGTTVVITVSAYEEPEPSPTETTAPPPPPPTTRPPAPPPTTRPPAPTPTPTTPPPTPRPTTPPPTTPPATLTTPPEPGGTPTIGTTP